MLTLQRREGESLVIQHNGEEILITLTECHKGKTKISVEGPKTFDSLFYYIF